MGANTVDIDFGTFGLDSSNDIAIDKIAVQLKKAVKQSVIPKGRGSVIPVGVKSSVGVKCSGSVIGTNYDDLRTNLDALKAALNSTSEEKFTTDDDRYLMCQYRNFSYSYEALRTFASFSFDLIASDPFWYSETLNKDETVTTAAPSQNMTNAGNAKTRCILTITADASNAIDDDIILVNSTLGLTINYSGLIAVTKSLIINNAVDQKDITVENDGTDDITNFDGDLPMMASGSNTWVLTTSTTGVTVGIEWRDAWE